MILVLGVGGWWVVFFWVKPPPNTKKRTCVFGFGKQKTTVWTEYVYVVILCICDR